MADIDLGTYRDDSVIQRDWWNPITAIKAAIQSGTTSIVSLGVTVGTDGIVWGTDSSGDIGADAARPANIFTDSIDIGAVGASGVITSPSEGMLSTAALRLSGSPITVGSGTGLTVDEIGDVRRMVYKCTLTYLGLVAAATTAKHTICTLPAGMRILGVIADTTTKYIGGSVSACTLAVGIDSGNVDAFLEEHDVFAAAIVTGDATADPGVELIAATDTGGGYIDWASTTVVSAIIVTTSDDTDALTQGVTTFYITVEQIK